MNRKILLIIPIAIILIIFIINFSTISKILFPKETWIDANVEESPYIKGGIIHINVRDSENGEIIESKEKIINVTLTDKKGNTGSELKHSSCSVYRYGGSNDEAWKNLSAYGDFTLYVDYPGETGYKPSNLTKNITIHVIEEKSKSQTSSTSKSTHNSYYDIIAKSRNPGAQYSGEEGDYYVYTYHSNLPYGDNHIKINKYTGEIF